MLVIYILLFVLEIILIVKAIKVDDIKHWVVAFAVEVLLFFMPLTINEVFFNESWNNTVLCNPQLNREVAIFYFVVLMLTVLFKYIMVKSIEMFRDPNGIKKLFVSILVLVLIFVVYGAFPKLTEYHLVVKNAKNTFMNDNKTVIVTICIIIIAVAVINGLWNKMCEKRYVKEIARMKAKSEQGVICPKCKMNNKLGRAKCVGCNYRLFGDIRLIIFDKREILQVCMDMDNEYEDSALSDKVEKLIKQFSEEKLQVMLVGTAMNGNEIRIIKKSKLYRYFSDTFLLKKRTSVKKDMELFKQMITKSGVMAEKVLFLSDNTNAKLHIAKEVGINCLNISAISELMD